jgi:hypothetical protein
MEDQEYPAEKIASVPTMAQRSGDFSDTRDNQNRLITIYDPLTGRQEGAFLPIALTTSRKRSWSSIQRRTL